MKVAGRFTLPYLIILNQSDKPTYIAEVLTVWQFRILREHTVSHLEATCIGQAVFNLECIQVTFFLDYIKRFYRVDVLFLSLIHI